MGWLEENSRRLLPIHALRLSEATDTLLGQAAASGSCMKAHEDPQDCAGTLKAPQTQGGRKMSSAEDRVVPIQSA